MNSTKIFKDKTDFYIDQILPYILIIIGLISISICIYHYKYKTCIIDELDEDNEVNVNLLKHHKIDI